MDNIKHTPTPWVNRHGRIEGEDGGFWIAEVVAYYAEHEAAQRANAEFIVRACNAHEQLVTALTLARARCFDQRPPMTLSKCATMQKYMDDMFAIDTALAAAGAV